MIGLGRRREIIGAVVSHFMVIDVNMRHPAVVNLEPLPAFNLGDPCPVAVQVEQIVVETSARPGLDVLAGEYMGIGYPVGSLGIIIHVAVAAVGIYSRIHHHNRIFEPCRPFSIVGIGKPVDGLHGCFHA